MLKNISCKFIFPPSLLPEQPPVSIAVLKSYLSCKGYTDIECLDWNMEFFYYIQNFIELDQPIGVGKNRLGIKIAILDILNNNLMLNQRYQYIIKEKYSQQISHWAPPFAFSYYELLSKIENDAEAVNDFLDNPNNVYNGFFNYLETQNRNSLFWCEYIGFSIIGFFQVIPALTLAKRIKQVNPSIHISFGGPWVTLFSDVLISCFGGNSLFDYVDSFSIGEGEYAVEALLEYISGVRNYEDVPNTILKVGNEYKDISTFVQFNMDDNTFPPDYRDFDLEKYLSFIEGEGRITVQSSRGCYHHRCSFCNALTNLNSKNLRQKNISNFINDLEILYKRHPNVKVFDFADNVSSPERLYALADFFEKKELAWEIDIRLDKWVDTSIISRALETNGLLRFGLESVSQSLLDLHQKGNNMSVVNTILNICMRLNYKPYIMTIIGLPGETEEEAYDLCEYLISRIDHIIPLVEDFNLERNTDIFFHPNQYGIKIFKNSKLAPYIPFEREAGYSSNLADKIYEDIFVKINKAAYKELIMDIPPIFTNKINAFININDNLKMKIELQYNDEDFHDLNPHFKQALQKRGLYLKNNACIQLHSIEYLE